MKKFFTKLIATLVIGTIVVSPIHSYAFLGFGDISFDTIQDATGISQTLLDVEQVINTVQQVLKAFGLDVVIYKVSQKLSQKLLNKVLNKANGGADGEDSKLFVENFGKYFQDISKQQIGTFTNMLSNSTSPFAQSISMGISDTAGGDLGSSKSLLESFSLNDVLPSGTKWQDAANDVTYAGDKGWDFYGSLAQPQNSPLGAAIIAQDDLAKKIQQTQDTAKTELSSSGFKPDKAKSSLGGMFQNMGQESFSGSVNTDGDIKTPTKTTEDQSGQSVNETFDRLRNADSFGKILFGTIQQMVTGLIEKGFSSLASDGGAVQKPYGGPKDLNKVLNSSASWASAPEQVVDLRNELEVAIEKTSIEIKLLEDTIDSIKIPVNDGTVLDLEACIPGPDTNWDKRLQAYLEAQTKDTQERAGQDGAKGSNNANALNIIRRLTQVATIEEKGLVSNPFLNIPAAAEMQSALKEYYKLSGKFKPLFDQVVIKRQTLTNLQTLRAKAQAYGAQANNNVPLVLFDTQWSKMTQAQKNQLYTSITPDLIANFPEYLNPSNQTQLAALPADDPATPDVNEKDDALKKRVYDVEWDKWETLVPDKTKQQLYAQFISLSRDISDSASVQRAQVSKDGAANQNEDLHKIKNDCLAIRAYVTQPNASANDTTFANSLSSERIKSAFSGPSILNAAANGTDFNKLNQRAVREQAELPGLTEGASFVAGADLGPALAADDIANKLQVPILAQTPQQVISQDSDQKLFCRLTVYHIWFWAPSPTDASLTGGPMGCNPQPGICHIGPGGYSVCPEKKINPNWYHTNNAEILFDISD